jgi:hypothetical protein
LDLLAEYAVYFFLGFLCSLHYAKIKERLLPIRYWLLLGLGLYLFYPSLQSSWPATFPFAILSVFIVWSIAVIILAKSRSCRFCFEVFGDYAYGIYAYSYFFTVPIRILFMRILPISDVAVAAAALVVGLVFPPLLVKYVLSRNAFLRRWALGDWGSTDKGWVRVSISSGPTQLAQVTPPSD